MNVDTQARQGSGLDLVLAANARGRGKHSTLYLWLQRHHARLKAEFAAKGADWHALCEAFAQLGLMDAAGKPPNVRTAQQTWYRLNRALDARAEAKTQAKAAKPPAPVTVTQEPPAPAPAPEADTSNDAEQPRYTFRPGRLRD